MALQPQGWVKQQSIWHWMLKHLEQKRNLILLIVVDSDGSSPGKSGAKLAVAEDGSRFGTIGGGLVEHKLINQARALLADADKTEIKPLLMRELHHSDLLQEGGHMICGGEQSVALYLCTDAALPLIETLTINTENNRRSVLIATECGLQCVADSEVKIQSTINSAKSWCYKEIIGHNNTAYIIGGGHVSLALSKILDMLQFNVVVLDERENVETMVNNHHASRKQVVNYRQVGDFVPDGEQVFIFVMTHSHGTDILAVEKLAAKKVAYIGVLGSRNKIKTLKQKLAERIDETLLAKLHAPIGLPIKSHTPAEIAISIAAELIALINSGPKSE